MTCSVAVETPCKINLHLGVHHQKDARGYHRVDSVMVPVALTDVVEARPARGLSVSFEPSLEVPAEKTGVWRAATLLAEALGVSPDVEVRVRARIPERAGLGGSSADAGAALRALCELWGADPRDPRVVGVARSVGADVAFFLHPEPALFLGAGDVLERAFPPLDVPLVLVMPGSMGGSTPEAYAEFDRAGSDPEPYEEMCAALQTGDVSSVATHLHNNLGDAARSLCPEIEDVEAWGRAQPEVLAAQVTGSGSCSFGFCLSDGAAREVAARAASERGWRSWATKTWTD